MKGKMRKQRSGREGRGKNEKEEKRAIVRKGNKMR